MVILDVYGEIEKTLISEKLQLYVGNLPNEKDNEWNQYLCKVMEKEMMQQELDSLEFKRDYGKTTYDLSYMKQVYNKNFNSDVIDDKWEINRYIQHFANNMIYLFFDYNYKDMPFFDWKTNCFDSRFCEEDYAEKIINLIRFVRKDNIGEPIPNCIYSSNQDDLEKTRILSMLQLKQSNDTKKYIKDLQNWGKRIDKFLEQENDYYQLDYIINVLYKDNEYNTNHLFKDFSILEMLLVRNGAKTNTIDNKLLDFLYKDYKGESENIAKLLRQMRNKIAHGDFSGFYKIAEKYTKIYLDKYDFDYSEYSRLNWILLNICCLLDDILAKIIKIMLEDKSKLIEIKNQ